MNEIKKHNKHSIQDIEISRTHAKKHMAKKVKRSVHDSIDNRARSHKRSKPRKVSKMTFIASVLLFLSAVFVLYVFLKPAHATVVIEPTVKNVTLSDDYVHVAYKNPEEGDIAFNVASTTVVVSKTLKADKQETVEEKASGIITVFNDHSSTPQRIIRNTRFQSPDGKIYRVKKPFTIPGKKSGKPGSIDVKVYAEEVGESYNTKSGTKFTLPALSGDIAKKITAVAKTDISGGFKGVRATVSSQQKQEAVEALKREIEQKALSSALASIGEDFVSFPDAVFINMDDPEYDYQQDVLTITLMAQAILPVFNKYEFARELLSSSYADIDTSASSKPYIANLEDITLKLQNKDGLDLEEDEVVKFTAQGTAKVMYEIDIDALKQELKGKNITVAKFIEGSYPGVKKVQDAVIKPFWRDSFPEDVELIDVIIKHNTN